MENESRELQIILIILILLTLFFAYLSIPGHGSKGPEHKLSLKAHTKGMVHSNKEGAAQHGEKTAKAQSEGQSKKNAKKTSKIEALTPDGYNVIAMNNPLYKTHKKGIVLFTHAKHIKDYNISCGDCHHDDKGQPLELKEGDPVQDCIECHKETEKVKGEKLSKEEKIMKYHFEAIHANCINCHKQFNIDNGDPKGKKPSPVSCGDCHPKNK